MRGNESLWIGVGAGCALLVLCGLCITGAAAMVLVRGAPLAPSPSPPVVGPATPSGPGTSAGTDLRHIRATVTEVSGLPDVSVGASCVADVTRHDRDDGTFWCNAQITCGPRSVYGGPDAGFFPCTLYAGARRDVLGSDASTSSVDQDPAMSLDTRASALEVHDDAGGRNGAMRVVARIDAIE